MQFVPAEPVHFPAIIALVNAAYRGEASKAGWTTEAWLIDGDKRTDETQLAEMLLVPGSQLLQAIDDAGDLQGVVYLKPTDRGVYLGMLSVWPQRQAAGTGKLLMAAAEAAATRMGHACIYMNVVSARHELIAWYQRRGYVLTGETAPFPASQQYGMPNTQLQFVVMEKKW